MMTEFQGWIALTEMRLITGLTSMGIVWTDIAYPQVWIYSWKKHK